MNRVWFALSLALLVASCTSTAPPPPLSTVPRVELDRYAGSWHEVALYPNRFQQACAADTTATYTPLGDGRIGVRNSCRRADGSEMAVDGVAEVVDAATNAKLKVSFFRPIWGKYWIIDLADDYSYAVVGHPGRDYLWILSRTRALPETTYQGILGRLQAVSYDTTRLVRTLQP